MKKATLVGTGLIGGSIGLALKGAGWTVVGTDHDDERAKVALDRGAIDEIGEDPASDLTVVATPVGHVVDEARRRLDAGHRVVTDVGSVKGPIVGALVTPHFLGGHPMAGSEQHGIEAADADLFVGATWVLTPTPATGDLVYRNVRNAVTELGAEIVDLDPNRHDALVAEVSHVPHLMAVTLMRLAAQTSIEQRTLLRLAAGGFRDMTRIASGHPGIWPDIVSENRSAILEVLDRLIGELSTVRDTVERQDRPELLRMLEAARAARENIPTGFRPEDLSELRIPIPDKPGAFARVHSVAAALDINIVDSDVVHSSEGDRGVLTLLVETTEADRLRDELVKLSFSVSTPRPL